jgi:hypothetical protein
MLKQKYFLTDFFILSAEKQPIKSLWRKIEWLHHIIVSCFGNLVVYLLAYIKVHGYDKQIRKYGSDDSQ